MNDLPVRKNIRLPGFDYSQNGAYFITICIENKECILSHIPRRGDPRGRPEVELTELGEICLQTFETIENTYGIKIDNFVIMPNHVHFIAFLSSDNRETARVAPTATVGAIVGAYKSLVANKWLTVCKSNNVFMGRLWQRNYYEHIIRDENDYLTKWQYIDENPARWEDDCYF